MSRRLFHRLAKGLVWGLVASLSVLSLAGARSIKLAPLLEEPFLPITVAPGVEVGRLTIFPVMARGKVRPLDVLSLDQAMKSGRLVITEHKRARVRSLTAANKSDKAVFIMAGEMIVGAKQDRMVGQDIVIPPLSSLEIPVYCVEKRRWRHVSRKFSSLGRAAPQKVRSLAYAKVSQRRVWTGVGEVNERVGAKPPTATLRAAYQDPKVKQKIKQYLGRLNQLPQKYSRMVGVVVVVKGRFLAADIFGRPELFARMWPKLVRSYALDAVGGSAQGPALAGPLAVRQMLRGLDYSWRSVVKGLGLGWNRQSARDGLKAHALFAMGTVVHFAAFPDLGPHTSGGLRPGRLAPRSLLRQYQRRSPVR